MHRFNFAPLARDAETPDWGAVLAITVSGLALLLLLVPPGPADTGTTPVALPAASSPVESDEVAYEKWIEQETGIPRSLP